MDKLPSLAPVPRVIPGRTAILISWCGYPEYGLQLSIEDVFGRPVDVVPRRAIREELRETILTDAIEI